jgi:hypothetical protein
MLCFALVTVNESEVDILVYKLEIVDQEYSVWKYEEMCAIKMKFL